MIELKKIIDQIRSEVEVNEKGEGSLSIRALARICDINHKTLVDHFNRGEFGDFNPSKLAQTLIEHGIEPWGFGQHGVPDIAAYLVIDYYAYNAGKNCTEFAKMAQKAIGAIGMRQWCRDVTGWSDKESKAVVTDSSSIENMFAAMMQKFENQMETSRNIFMEEIREIKEEKKVLEEFKDDVENYSEFSRLLEIAKNDVDENDYSDGISCRDYVRDNGIPLHDNAYCTLSRRTASYYRSTKGKNPTKRSSNNIYSGKDVAYIIATIQMIMRGL